MPGIMHEVHKRTIKNTAVVAIFLAAAPLSSLVKQNASLFLYMLKAKKRPAAMVKITTGGPVGMIAVKRPRLRKQKWALSPFFSSPFFSISSLTEENT